MVLKFILFYRQLNLASLTFEKREKVIQQIGLIFIEAIEIFKDRKNNNRGWDEAKLHK